MTLSLSLLTIRHLSHCPGIAYAQEASVWERERGRQAGRPAGREAVWEGESEEGTARDGQAKIDKEGGREEVGEEGVETMSSSLWP